MVQVYGKRSRSWMYDESQHDDESTVELSDEGEVISASTEQAIVSGSGIATSSFRVDSHDSNEDTPTLVSSTESYLGDNSNATNTSIAQDNDMSPLKAFDFLQNQSISKKRKRNYKKTSIEDLEDSESYRVRENPIDKTVDELNQFLVSLQSTNADVKIKEKLENELEKSLEEGLSSHSERVMYDRSRTILFDKDEDGIEMPEPDQRTEAVAEAPKTKQKIEKHSTHHYNELKNIGEAIKYQDELEFLTEDSPASLNIETFISRFLTLLMSIEQDKELQEYIDRHATREVCRWCFSKKPDSHPVVTFLQGFLLTKIQVPPDDLPFYFEQLILSSLVCVQPPKLRSVSSKMTRLNLEDFLSNTGNKPAREYSLRLCLKYPDQALSPEVTTQILDIVTRKDSVPSSASLVYSLVEHILSSCSSVLAKVPTAAILLSNLISALPEQCCNEALVKSLIILSNEQKLLSETPTELKEKLVRCSLAFVLKNIHPIKDTTADLIILHLGLLLNMSDACDVRLFEKSQLDTARKLLFSVSASDTDPFIVCMYSLNLTHLLFRAGEELHEEEKDLLKSSLNSFDNENMHFNQVIKDQIKAALDNFYK